MTPTQFQTYIDGRVAQEQDEYSLTILLRVQQYLQVMQPRTMELITNHLNAEAKDYRIRAAEMRLSAPNIMVADIYVAYANAYEELVERVYGNKVQGREKA